MVLMGVSTAMKALLVHILSHQMQNLTLFASGQHIMSVLLKSCLISTCGSQVVWVSRGVVFRAEV